MNNLEGQATNVVQPYPLLFAPILQQRVWGGRSLCDVFPGCPQGPVGEAWTLSGHPASPSVCLNGPLTGLTLPEIVHRHPAAYWGTAGRFPVLIKFIDAVQDLSVQVHPGDRPEGEPGSAQGKTESWYVLAARPEAQIVVGLDLHTRADVEQAIDRNNLAAHLLRRRVQAGQLVHIPAGTVHALSGGVQVIEIQQTSDITYRLFDWNRVGGDGRRRDLHIAQALSAINYGDRPAEDRAPISFPLPQATRHLLQCRHYAVDELVLTRPDWVLPSIRPRILIVSAGRGQLRWGGNDYALRFGDTYLFPGCQEAARLLPQGELRLLAVAFTEDAR